MDETDRTREDEWFHRHEKDRLEAAQQVRDQRQRERESKESEEERRRLKELHFMKCPKCGHDMKTEDLSGVEIDRCIFCEGIYMDPGEIEELFRRQEGERKSIVRRLLGI